MSTDYEAIRLENIEGYGKNSDHLFLIADLYSTRTHFIYEILQNAEDALSCRTEGSTAGYIHFHLHSDRLEIRHNGKPFTEKNVIGVCGVGKSTKKGDCNQIGKLGIGFKSVYAYTFFPQIHSGSEHFEIQRFVEPHELPSVEDLDTLIIIPFDQPDKRPEWAFKEGEPVVREDVLAADAVCEIGSAIRTLGLRTMLFLQHIEEIKWTLPDNTTGHFIRNTKQIPYRDGLRKVEVLDQNNHFEQWWIFSRDVEVQDAGKVCPVAVEIAYLIKDGAVTRAEDTKLVVFFPTDRTTELGFLIQAPFKTTKARDNIKTDVTANQQMLETAAQLAADSLLVLRDLELLNVASYGAFPLKESDFSPNQQGVPHLFRPVFDKVREALKTLPLLPSEGGGFIKADAAKLASVGELVGLFSSVQLSLLFDRDGLAWLDKEIATEKCRDLRLYLLELAAGMEVRPETLVPKLTADFLVKQPMDWLTSFIQYAMQGAQSLRRVPFIRLKSGGHVSMPTDKLAQPTAWFAPLDNAGLDLSVFPLVLPELVANEQIRKLLEKESLREIDAAAIVGKCILPRYKGVNTPFDEPNYRDHLRQIRKAYIEANDAAKKQLTTNLDGIEWLACIHASGNAQNKIVWKKPRASDIFPRTKDNEIWFHGLESVGAYFLHPSVDDVLNGVVTSLVNFRGYLWETKKPWHYLPPTEPIDDPNSTNKIVLIWQQNNYQEAQDGFHPDAEICGLSDALDYPSMERATILWGNLIKSPHLIKGVVLRAKTVAGLISAQRIPEFSKAGKILAKTAWLPDQAGNFRKPNELLLTNLPRGFDTTSIHAKDVVEKLGMKKPEVEQALDLVTNGDDDLKKLIAAYQSGSNADRERLRKMIPQELPPQPAPSFKDTLSNMTRQQQVMPLDDENFPRSYPVSNPNYRQENLNQLVADGVREHAASPKIIRFSLVRDQPSNKEARRTLYQEYHGHCQVTHETFPKASANANANGEAANYFEVCSLVSYGNADYFNDAGNMLSVSANTMAKFKCASFDWLDNIDGKIEEFENGGKTAQEIKIRIRLAGEECTITWSQRHFMRLVALYQNT